MTWTLLHDRMAFMAEVIKAAEPGLHALVKIGSRRSVRMRALSRGEHVAVGLFGGPAGDRQTVA
jgi:hypothetical protein